MAVIDENQIKTIFEIDRSGELYRRLLDIFETDMPKHILELETAIKREDFANAKKLSHSIKSTSLNMGATDLSNIAGKLEDSIEVTKDQNLAPVIELRECFQKTLTELRGYTNLCKK